VSGVPIASPDVLEVVVQFMIIDLRFVLVLIVFGEQRAGRIGFGLIGVG
jgi:hypothetical protein